jgi:L,D-transpeptidase catalytic domain
MSGAHARRSRRETLWRGRSGRIGFGVVVAVLTLGLAGGLVWSVGVAQKGAAAGKPANHARTDARTRAARTRAAHARRVQPTTMQVSGILPSTSSGPISGSESIVVELSEPLAAHSPMPQASIAGTWQKSGTSLSFQPTVGLIPSSTVTVTVPGGASGLKGVDGARLAAPVQASWTVQPGNLLRAYQLLATLNYLPVTWSPSTPGQLTSAEQDAALYNPPAGTFAWEYPNTPSQIQGLWSPGADNLLLQGAVMAFESNQGLTMDGVVGSEVWTKLLTATASPAAIAANSNQSGYTYTFVTKVLPETMTVWHDGSVVEQTPVNTGIPSDPTVDGTFPVYERLQSQVMMGTNPDGSQYADPVAWVAYFNGGDAVHYIARGSYGYPQSLGCVEASYSAAEQAWPYLTLGSLVTISG